MSNCIKTGCHVFLEPYCEYAYGDAFEEEGMLVLRLAARSLYPINGNKVIHFTIRDWSSWFDADKTSMDQNSTLLSSPTFWTGHGYEGKSL